MIHDKITFSLALEGFFWGLESLDWRNKMIISLHLKEKVDSMPSSAPSECKGSMFVGE